MSEQEFESYLRLLCRFLHLSGGQRDQIARELRNHMEDRLEELMARGYTRDEAIQSALDEFGDAAALAGDFGRIGQRRRWIMRTTGGIVGITAAVLFVSFLLPENRRHVPAPAYSIASDNGEKLKTARTTSQPAAGKLVVAAAAESNAEAEARTQLAKVMPEVAFPEGSTLEQVVDFLRTQGKLSIDVNWNALSQAGIDRTATMSLDLHQVKLETALSLALANVSGGVKLGYDLDDNVLRISTMEDLNKKTITRVYDCKDLTQGEVTDQQLAQITSIIDEGLKSKLSASDSELLRSRLKTFADHNLVDLIKAHVQPEMWDGGGSVTVYDGLLVVTSNASAQHEVTQLLEMMRTIKLARGESANHGTAQVIETPTHVNLVDVNSDLIGGHVR